MGRTVIRVRVNTITTHGLALNEIGQPIPAIYLYIHTPTHLYTHPQIRALPSGW